MSAQPADAESKAALDHLTTIMATGRALVVDGGLGFTI
jgi:hypothetical protein